MFPLAFLLGWLPMDNGTTSAVLPWPGPSWCEPPWDNDEVPDGTWRQHLWRQILWKLHGFKQKKMHAKNQDLSNETGTSTTKDCSLGFQAVPSSIERSTDCFWWFQQPEKGWCTATKKYSSSKRIKIQQEWLVVSTCVTWFENVDPSQKYASHLNQTSNFYGWTTHEYLNPPTRRYYHPT